MVRIRKPLLMESEGSVTRWIGRLKGGDDEAARLLWQRYFERLVRLARDRLRGARRLGADRDEEDVALSALDSVCRGAAAGQFPGLGDRDDLWRLLVIIAARKALNLMRDQGRQKRGGGRTRAAADLGGGDDEEAALARIVGAEPTPEFAAIVAEEFQLRLAGLQDEALRRVALMRMEGYSNAEIADCLGCTTRTVVRKIEVIRRHWQE